MVDRISFGDRLGEARRLGRKKERRREGRRLTIQHPELPLTHLVRPLLFSPFRTHAHAHTHAYPISFRLILDHSLAQPPHRLTLLPPPGLCRPCSRSGWVVDERLVVVGSRLARRMRLAERVEMWRVVAVVMGVLGMWRDVRVKMERIGMPRPHARISRIRSVVRHSG